MPRCYISRVRWKARPELVSGCQRSSTGTHTKTRHKGVQGRPLCPPADTSDAHWYLGQRRRALDALPL